MPDSRALRPSALAVCLLLSVLMIARRSAAGEPPPIPTLALSVAVAHEHGQPVVSPAWVSRQVGEAVRLLAPHGLSVKVVAQPELDASFAVLDTPVDRDSLAPALSPHVINVFVVRSLRDIDHPDRFIRGVRWRLRQNLARSYIILAAGAPPTVLAHELGHHLGNDHSYVLDNIMSYRRENPAKVAFDRVQGAKMRRHATALLLRQVLWPAERLEPPPRGDL